MNILKDLKANLCVLVKISKIFSQTFRHEHSGLIENRCFEVPSQYLLTRGSGSEIHYLDSTDRSVPCIFAIIQGESKAEYLSNLVLSEEITVDRNPITQSSSYKYLAQVIRIGLDNQTCEINRRIGLTWASFVNCHLEIKHPSKPKEEDFQSMHTAGADLRSRSSFTQKTSR